MWRAKFDTRFSFVLVCFSFGEESRWRRGALQRLCQYLLVAGNLPIACVEPGDSYRHWTYSNIASSLSKETSFPVRLQDSLSIGSHLTITHHHPAPQPSLQTALDTYRISGHAFQLFLASCLNIRINFSPSHSTSRNTIPNRESSTES